MVHVQALPGDDGGGGVEKAEGAAAQGQDLLRQGLAGEGAGGHDGRARRELGDLLPPRG